MDTVVSPHTQCMMKDKGKGKEKDKDKDITYTNFNHNNHFKMNYKIDNDISTNFSTFITNSYSTIGMTIIDLPVDIINLLVNDYLSLIDSYHFCLSCATIFQQYQIPNFDMVISYKLFQNKNLSLNQLKKKYKNIKRNLRAKSLPSLTSLTTSTLIDYNDSNLFKKNISFKEISSNNLKGKINKLKAAYISPYNLDAFLNISGVTNLEMSVIDCKWDLNENSNINNNSDDNDQHLIQFIPFNDDYARPNGREVFKLRKSNEVIASLPKEITQISLPLDKIDWKNIDIIDNVQQQWKFPLFENDDTTSTSSTSTKRRRLSQDNYNDTNQKSRYEEPVTVDVFENLKETQLCEKLQEFYEWTAVNDKYFISLSKDDSSFPDMTLLLSCYIIDEQLKSKLIWKVELTCKQFAIILASPQKIQVSENLILVPIRICDEELSYSWHIFDISTGYYYGCFQMPSEPNVELDNDYTLSEFEEDSPNMHIPINDKYRTGPLHIHGTEVFLQLYFGKITKSLHSRWQLLSMSLESFLYQLDKNDKLINVNTIYKNFKNNQNLHNKYIYKSLLSSTNSQCYGWNLIFETPNIDDEQLINYNDIVNDFDIDIDISLLEVLEPGISVKSYFWGNTIAILINYHAISNTRAHWFKLKSDYLFLYNIEKDKSKGIKFHNWNKELNCKNNLIIVDEDLNFVVLNSNSVKIPIEK